MAEMALPAAEIPHFARNDTQRVSFTLDMQCVSAYCIPLSGASCNRGASSPDNARRLPIP